MRSSRVTATVLLAMVALASCTQSRVDPNADIQIGGSLRRQDGTPVSGASLSLGEGPDFLDVVSTVTTLGLACLTDELPNACENRRVTKSDADGTFLYEMKGSDTQGFLGNASTLDLSTHLPRSGEQLDGPSLTMRFQVQTERLNLPLRLWEPTVRVTGDERELSARWSALPANILPPQGSLDGVRTSIRFARGDERVWTYSLASSGGRFDPRYLEDSRGSVAVVAEQQGLSVGDSFGANIDMVWRSARFPYVSPIAAPTSRNARCFVYDAKKKPVSQANCPVTDGVFDDTFAPTTCPPVESCEEPAHSSVYLDLGKTEWITLVVVRECNGRCVVEVSPNARKWTLVGSGGQGQEHLGIAPAGNVRARYVRVRSDSSVMGLGEVSVWNRTRTPAANDPEGDSILTTLRAANQEPLATDGGDTFPLKLVLLVLAMIGIAGAAFMLGRARNMPPPHPRA